MSSPVLGERAAAFVPAAPSQPRVSRRGALLALAAAMCWSTSGTFIRVIVDRYGLTPWGLAFWRDSLAFTSFLIIALVTRTPLQVRRADLLPLAGMGALSIGIFHVTWVLAVTMIPVAVATVLNYTAPAFVVVFAWALWGERPNRRQAAALALAFAGCVLVSGAYNVTNEQLNWPGLLVGLSTGVTYATFVVIGKDMLRRYGSWTVLTYAFGFAALTLLVLNPTAGLALFAGPWHAWAWVLGLVLFSTVTGFGLYGLGLKHLSATTASITTTIEPVLAAGLAFMLLGQSIDPAQMLGGVLVIAAVILLTR